MSDTTRREFLRRAARAAAFIGLGALAARLLGRRGEFTAPVPCLRCALLAGCRRPDGAEARRALGGDSSARPDASEAPGLCGERADGGLPTRWVRREDA